MKQLVFVVLGLLFFLVACNHNKEQVDVTESIQKESNTLKVKSDKEITEISEGQKLFILCTEANRIKLGRVCMVYSERKQEQERDLNIPRSC